MIVHQIFLKPMNTTLMIHGSDIHFQAIDQVEFSNQYLYAGQSLVTWSTMTEFWRSSLQNPLPILQQGRDYQLDIYYSSIPDQRLYIKVIFFNRYKERIDQKVFKQRSNILSVPKEAIHYQIELVNGGLESFCFYQLNLSLMEKYQNQFLLKDSDLQISNFINPNEQDHTLRIVFTEPRLSTVHSFDFAKLTKAQNIIQITNTRALAQLYLSKGQLDLRIVHLILQLITEYDVRQVSFIGYGPISNYACLKYRDQFLDIPTRVYLSKQNHPDYPLIYHQIAGFDDFATKKYSPHQTDCYYGSTVGESLMPDVNLENQLSTCPAWEE